VDILRTSGLKSLYHEHFNLKESESYSPTFVTTRKNFHHLDHIFGSEFFLKKMKDFQIDDFKNVVLSDHAPLLLEVEIEKLKDVA